jgi:hypothetical protein
MKSTLAIVLMICAPLIAGALVIAAIKGREMYANWQYARAVEKRNARLVRHSLTPFRGVKVRQ